MSDTHGVSTDGPPAVLQAIARAAGELQDARTLPDAIAATAVAALEITGALEAAVVTAPGGDWARGHRAVARPEGTAVDTAPVSISAFERRAFERCIGVRAATRVSTPDGRTRRDVVVAVPLLGRRGERLGVVHARRPSAPGGADAHEHALTVIAGLGGAAIARLRIEQRLARLERTEAAGRLATGLAHDVRNALATILGAADNALTRQREMPAGLRGDLEAIRAAAGAGADITRRLLNVARSRGRPAQLIDIDAALAASTRMLEILAGPSVEVRVRRTPDLPPVEITPGALEQALANLVTNARDAMPDGGRLELQASPAETSGGRTGLPPGRHVRLSVRDSGGGMDEATRRRALEPFFTTKAPGEGTGLGLSSVAEALRALGGDVLVDSAPGSGTTVHLLLPAAERPARRRSPRPVGGDETIAVVEDDERLRAVICAMLRTLGYRVIAGGSAGEVQPASGGAPPDLLLADCRLDGAGGPQVAQALRRADPGLPVLYMSGYDRELALGERQDRRALFLEKPFDVAALAEHVRDALDLRG